MGETDHICGPNVIEKTSRVRLKKLIHGRRRLNDQFKCGGCQSTFTTICSLHVHCGKHNEGGSYYFDCVTSTAFPKYDTACVYTQVTSEDFKTVLQNPDQEDTELPEQTKQHDRSFLSVRNSKRIALRGQKQGGSDDEKNKSDIKGSAITEIRRQNIVNVFEGIRHICTLKDDGTEVENISTDKPSRSSLGKRTTKLDNEHNSNDKKNLEAPQRKQYFHKKRKSRKYDTEISVTDKTECSADKNRKKSNKLIKAQLVNSETVINNYQKMNDNKNKAKTSSSLSDTIDVNENTNKLESDTHEKDELTASEVLLAISKGDNADLTMNDADIVQKFEKNISVESQTVNASSCTDSEDNMKMADEISCKTNRQGSKNKGVSRKNNENMKRELECQTCGRKGTSGMIAYHKYLHMDRKSFACEICGQLFRIPRSLAIHKRQHEEKQFRCDFCPAAFHRKQYLETHLLKHSGESPFMCDLCGKAYRDRSHLKRHIKHVHEKKRDFECDICQEKFFRSDHLKNHRLRHFEADKQCKYCDRMFKHPEDLVRHTRTHTGQKEWYCHICGHGFVAVAPYYKHMAKKHSIGRDEAKIWKNKCREVCRQKQTDSTWQKPAVSETGKTTGHPSYSTLPTDTAEQFFSSRNSSLTPLRSFSVPTNEASTYVDLPDSDVPDKQGSLDDHFSDSALLIKYAIVSDDSKSFMEEDIYNLQGSSVNDLMQGSAVAVESTVEGAMVTEVQNRESVDLNSESDFNVIIAVNSMDFNGETVMFIDGDQCQSEVVIDN